MSTQLRVMYVHTFYKGYMDTFYGKHPHLARASFSEQMTAFIRDAFSGVHMLIAYLPECKTQFVLANCREAQLAWLKENRRTLHDVDNWQDEVVRQQILDFQPDILYLGDCILHQAPFIASLPFRPKVIVSWRAADVPLGTDWTGYDVILSNLTPMLTLAESLGAGKGVMLQPGMPSWIAREVADMPHDLDVVFVGSVYPKVHIRRLALMEAVAEAATKHGFSLEMHLACNPELLSPAMRPYVRPAVYGMDMYKTVRRGKIVFDVSGSVGLRHPDGSYVVDLSRGDTGTMRLFETTGCGSLMIYNDMPGLSRIFEPGKEVVTFQDEKDLVKKILYYLAHPAARESIAAAGKARCLEEWNMKNMAQHFLHIVRSALAEKEL